MSTSANVHSLESIDAVRTYLLQEADARQTRVVMVTSATAGEGKTTLAGHLATSLARLLSSEGDSAAALGILRPIVTAFSAEAQHPDVRDASVQLQRIGAS